MENKEADNVTVSETLFSDTKTVYAAKVTALLENIWYPSESDEPIEWITFQAAITPPIIAKDLAAHLGFSDDIVLEEISTESFWLPIIMIEDWYGSEEQATVQKYLEIKALLENHLQDLRAFRVGTVEIDLFLIGQINDNEWAGLKTRVIET